MVFNSISFLIFFVVFFSIYYFLLNERTKWQNILLLIGSYFFYGYADWRMLPLLFFSTLLFYFFGIWIENGSEKKASILTNVGVILGVGILLYFKYLNFFIESFASLFEHVGLQTNWHTFNIIMPVGISFFTFKLISYIVEIHRGKIQADRNFIDFATYISFFPCILSGPIDRPNTFLPQLKKTRPFDYDFAVDGCRQILWGLFKKVVVADNLATYVNICWDNISGSSASTLVVAMFAYMFQMYADFSGYSDMAIGVGKLLGFNVTQNFKYPLFALNMADYWRRWHISLTSWLTDYVFMPLNIKFRNLGNTGIILAIIINMIVVGFWHGANWTFGLFGLYHGLLFIPLIISGTFFKKTKDKVNRFGLPSIKDFSKMLLTIILASFGLVIFRAPNIIDVWHYIVGFTGNWGVPDIISPTYILPIPFLILLLIIMEWNHRKCEHGLDISKWSKWQRWLTYFGIFILIFTFGAKAESFIYFQF